MSANHKPPPLYAAPFRKHCPVCDQVTYSAAGIHPQCAEQQADAERMQRQKRSRRPAAKPDPHGHLSAWQRICPGCRAVVHVRKKICDCGRSLAAR